MNKAQLIEAVMEANPNVFPNRRAAEKVLDSTLKIITEALAKDGEVRVINFGALVVKEMKERTARNIQTGESINVPAHKVVKFSASQRLKDKINA